MPISPVIVIPGITASDLQDEYELPPEAVWTTVLKRRYDRVTLHPEDQRYELREPARVMPRGPFPLIYENLIEELRDGLSEDQPGPVPVFPFGYDWRMPLNWTEQRLAAFVREVIDRTLLMRHYRNDEAFRNDPTVSLIGHSMGGLIIAGYVESLVAGRIRSPTGSGALVDKVVTLGTPFRGSYEAILKVATGTSELGDDSGRARERRMARMTPALYHLLPGSAGPVASHGGMAVNFFRPDAWQPNVVQTIEHQVREWDVTGAELFRKMLDEARTHRERISGLRLLNGGTPRAAGASDDGGSGDTAPLGDTGPPGDTGPLGDTAPPGDAGPPGDGGAPGDAGPPAVAVRSDDWLAIAGVDSKTRVGLRVVRDENGFARFDLRGAERRNEWDSDIEGNRRDTGDGTVPLEGAIPPFLDEARVVCVTPGDFGYWEIRDRALTAAAGFHGLLPRMNMLHRLILRFLLDRGDPYGNTWGRRLPGVGDWNPPLELAEKG